MTRGASTSFRQGSHADQRQGALPVGPGGGSSRKTDTHPDRSRAICGVACRRERDNAESRPGQRGENRAGRDDSHGQQFLPQAGGKIPCRGRPVCRAISDQSEPCLCDYPDGKQLQPLCRQFRSGLWVDATRADKRRAGCLSQSEGEDKAPTRDYLFDPDNNIELGTAYLNVLTYTQLDDVADLVSREYCVISAYNTGAGNVFKTFSKDQRAAVDQINRLQPSALYDRLRSSLPYQETRDYLAKVVGYRKQFVSLGENGPR